MRSDLLPSCDAPSSPLSPAALEGWRPEQLWLIEDCWHPTTLRLMSAAVQAAIEAELASTAAVSQAKAHLAILWRAGPKSIETLRQAARVVLESQLHPTQTGRDLAAAALFLAGLKVGDMGMIAAIEFSVEVCQRATALLVARADGPLPPGFASTKQLAKRMEARAGELTAHQFSLPWRKFASIADQLSQALTEDPLVRLAQDGTYDPPIAFSAVITSAGLRRDRRAAVSSTGGNGH